MDFVSDLFVGEVARFLSLESAVRFTQLSSAKWRKAGAEEQEKRLELFLHIPFFRGTTPTKYAFQQIGTKKRVRYYSIQDVLKLDRRHVQVPRVELTYSKVPKSYRKIKGGLEEVRALYTALKPFLASRLTICLAPTKSAKDTEAMSAAFDVFHDRISSIVDLTLCHTGPKAMQFLNDCVEQQALQKLTLVGAWPDEGTYTMIERFLLSRNAFWLDIEGSRLKLKWDYVKRAFDNFEKDKTALCRVNGRLMWDDDLRESHRPNQLIHSGQIAHMHFVDRWKLGKDQFMTGNYDAYRNFTLEPSIGT